MDQPLSDRSDATRRGVLPPHSRILLISDAWFPQVNGVVRTLSTIVGILTAGGDEVTVIGPDRFPGIPLPGYREIRLAFATPHRLAALIDAFAPDALHIATEGPLGWAARALCLRRGWRFTTAFHTRFPDYLYARLRLPRAWSWAVLRRFHAAAAATLAATPSLRAELAARGFTNLKPWTRGVDLRRFRPEPKEPWEGLQRPIFLYVGRVAVEKNIDAFLRLDLPGSKVVVGDGPQRAALARRYPTVVFAGRRDNGELARAYAGADVLVFPSRTDTFGLVILEALACGTPVAAFPVPGPRDIITDPRCGALDEDLRAACLRALTADRAICRACAEAWSWERAAAEFRAALVPLCAAASPPLAPLTRPEPCQATL